MRVLYRDAIPELVYHEHREENMSPDISILDALPEHVGVLKANLRVEDANEILRFGITVQRGLWLSFRHAIIKRTVLIDGIPVAMFGVHGDMLGTKGVPFLLTTEDVKKASPLKFVRIYQDSVHEMLKLFPVLENYVDANYSAAIRLLDIVGFSIGEPEPVGYNSAMFRKFRIERK